MGKKKPDKKKTSDKKKEVEKKVKFEIIKDSKFRLQKKINKVIEYAEENKDSIDKIYKSIYKNAKLIEYNDGNPRILKKFRTKVVKGVFSPWYLTQIELFRDRKKTYLKVTGGEIADENDIKNIFHLGKFMDNEEIACSMFKKDQKKESSLNNVNVKKNKEDGSFTIKFF